MAEFPDLHDFEFFVFFILMPALLLGGSLGLKLKFKRESIYLLLILAPAYNFLFHYHCGMKWTEYTVKVIEVFIFKVLGSQVSAITALFISNKFMDIVKKPKN